jgi:hypothetical protein
LSPAGELLREETRGLRRQNRNQSKLKKFWQEHISTAPAKIGVLSSNSGQETHRGWSIELQSSEIKSRRATDLEGSRESLALILNTRWQKSRSVQATHRRVHSLKEQYQHGFRKLLISASFCACMTLQRPAKITPSGSSNFFLFKCSNKTFTLTQEFLLTIEVGIAGDVRKCLRKTVKCRFQC